VIVLSGERDALIEWREGCEALRIANSEEGDPDALGRIVGGPRQGGVESENRIRSSEINRAQRTL